MCVHRAGEGALHAPFEPLLPAALPGQQAGLGPRFRLPVRADD